MYLTLHVINSLPLHCLNAGDDGLPKNHWDGGVQRSRLSPQSLKANARSEYLKGIAEDQVTYRTMRAHEIVLKKISEILGVPVDQLDPAVVQSSSLVIKTFTQSSADDDASPSDGDKGASEDGGKDKKDTIVLLAHAELDAIARDLAGRGPSKVLSKSAAATVARDAVLGLRNGRGSDASHAVLDIAAHGRMTAGQSSLGNLGFLIPSEASTTHEVVLTVDFGTARDDLKTTDDGAGAAHMFRNYYVSGDYYRTVTIDISGFFSTWLNWEAEGARDELARLIMCHLKALPTGHSRHTNRNTLPSLVLGEVTTTRTCYMFNTPVQPDAAGGYLSGTIEALSRQRSDLIFFSPESFGPSAVVAPPSVEAEFEASERLPRLSDIAEWAVEQIYAQAPQ